MSQRRLWPAEAAATRQQDGGQIFMAVFLRRCATPLANGSSQIAAIPSYFGCVFDPGLLSGPGYIHRKDLHKTDEVL